jgi:uncharacterized protein (DUF736 family)
MNIGKFQHQDGAYTGKVQTFPGGTVEMRIAPTDQKGVDYRVMVAGGDVELGAAWNKVSKEKGTKYISVKLDSPFAAQPAWCSLFTQSDGSYNLVWNRPDPTKKKKAEPEMAEQAAA